MHRLRKFGVRTSFDFRPDGFMCGFGDALSYRVEPVVYEALDLSSIGEFATANSVYFLRWTIFLIPLTLIFVYFFDSPLFEPFAGWMLLGVLFTMILFAVAMAREWAEVRFTEIPTFGTDSEGVRGFVRIIQTKHHDAVLNELRVRWRARMLAVHGALNPQAGFEAERARFEELLRHGILSEEEYRAMIEALYLAVATEPDSVVKVGH